VTKFREELVDAVEGPAELVLWVLDVPRLLVELEDVGRCEEVEDTFEELCELVLDEVNELQLLTELEELEDSRELVVAIFEVEPVELWLF
jgi:hypothetical protein